MRYELVPTYMSDGFFLSVEAISTDRRSKAVWVTQPRISLGLNQDASHLIEIQNSLRDTDFLVIDEATERSLPSAVSRTIFEDDGRIIRLRGIYKPLGLNGPRVAAIQSRADLRRLMLENIWQFQGGVDVFSLELLRRASENFAEYASFLTATDEHLTTVKRTLSALTAGTGVQITKMANGYTAAFICDISTLSHKSIRARDVLIDRLKHERVVPTFGASMYFANHPGYEFIRINSFTEERVLMESARRIARVLE